VSVGDYLDKTKAMPASLLTHWAAFLTLYKGSIGYKFKSAENKVLLALATKQLPGRYLLADTYRI